MKFLLTLILIALAIIIVVFVAPFCYYFINYVITIHKIEKKISNIEKEYNVFLIRKEYAEINRISYSEPFSITYQLKNTIITTNRISQATCLFVLTKLQNELDELLLKLPDEIKNTSSMKDCLLDFNKVKQGIAEANPYC